MIRPALFVRQQHHFFQDDGAGRHVIGAQYGAVAGLDLSQLVQHLHALHHLAEHRVTGAGIGVEVVVVHQVEVELAGGAVDRLGAGHGDATTLVGQAASGLVDHGIEGWQGLELLVVAPTLHHEVLDHPVEQAAVIAAVRHVAQEVLHRYRKQCLASSRCTWPRLLQTFRCDRTYQQKQKPWKPSRYGSKAF